MKIAFALDDSLDKTDGVQQYVLTLGNWLSNQGHEVHYLVGQTVRTDRENIHSLSRNISVRFNQNRMSVPLPVSRITIRNLLAVEKYDVVHVQMPFSPFLCGRIITEAPLATAIVATFHILPFSLFERSASRLLASVTKRSSKRIDKAISVSAPAAKFAQEAFNMPSEVVPNMVKTAIFKNAEPLDNYKNTFTIVFLGRLVERKGILQLLSAVQDKQKFLRDNQCKVVICGKGPLWDRVELYIRKNKLEQLVDLIGFVSESDKARYLASADMAIFPSISGESFGIVLIEAMAAGAGVVLGGNNPGYASVLGTESSTLFNPNSITEFANIIEKFVSDKTLRAQIHERQQAQVKQYDTDVVAMRIISIYKTAIAKHTRNI